MNSLDFFRSMVISILYIFSFLYFVLIILFIVGFNKCQLTKNSSLNVEKSFSIIIPFRNEASNLPELLNSLLNLHYPNSKFEILFVNDDSEDKSKNVIEVWQTKNSDINTSILNNKRLTNSPKKDALTFAISKSSYHWIVTTDADCTIPKNWLTFFNQIISEKKPFLIAAY